MESVTGEYLLEFDVGHVVHFMSRTMSHSDSSLYKGLCSYDWKLPFIMFPWFAVVAAFCVVVVVMVLADVCERVVRNQLPSIIEKLPLNSITDNNVDANPAANGFVSNDKSQQVGSLSLVIPRHIAVIMDGNRRYGRRKHGNAYKGHWDGGKVLVDFVDWCMESGVGALTAYAFSTENWNRDPAEIKALMSIFEKYCEEIHVHALKKNIRLRVLATDRERLPEHVRVAVDNMVAATFHCDGFQLNLCISYGGRGEIVNMCKELVTRCAEGKLSVDDIDEATVSRALLTGELADPDLLIRTSGETRLSNFLLYQLAYSELLFVNKCWPEMTRDDLQMAIVEFSRRKRRFGK